MAFWKLSHALDWSYSGVDHTIEGTGGMECVNFIPTNQKIVETISFILLGLGEMYIAYSHLSLPKQVPVGERMDRTGKRILLVIMCLTFGIELGFKFASRQMIWILNPCHIVTIMQIYILMAPPSRTVMAIFRIHLHCLNGATIALLLPVVNTRLLPFETEVYYIQHILMLVIPYYLMRIGGVYTPEPMLDWSWLVFSLGAGFVYHWIFLQALSMVSLVNLNNMLCPAVSDPFYGKWYRCWAAAHQTALIAIHGKIYCWIAQLFLPRRSADCDMVNESESNGHAKLH